MKFISYLHNNEHKFGILDNDLITDLTGKISGATSLKFMSNERVTIDLELYFYPFYFISALGMWLSVLAIIFWFIKELSRTKTIKEDI